MREVVYDPEMDPASVMDVPLYVTPVTTFVALRRFMQTTKSDAFAEQVCVKVSLENDWTVLFASNVIAIYLRL